jgi:hypothetical protein
MSLCLMALSQSPRLPLAVAEGMAKANPAADKVLLERLDADAELAGSSLARRSIDTLRAMISRHESRHLLDEIENNEDEE